MPQFDIFCFFSQLFWAFLGFIFLYLVLSLFVLPALAVILKIRKRKLGQVNQNSTQSLVTVDTEILKLGASTVDASLTLISNYSTNLLELNLNRSSSQLNISPIVETSASFRFFKLKNFNQIQIALLFFD
jgi:hypothetical protein